MIQSKHLHFSKSGKYSSINNYLDSFITGYRKKLLFSLINKNAIQIKSLELLEQLNITIRVLLRNTYVYDTIQRQSLVPIYLKTESEGFNFTISL